MKVSNKKYPYEMYCTVCNHVPAYLDHMPEAGTQIRSKGAILVNGKQPIPGSEILCDCKINPETGEYDFARGWAVRQRKETDNGTQKTN